MYDPFVLASSQEEGNFKLLNSRITELEAHMSEASTAISHLERIISEKDRRINTLEEQVSNRRSIDIKQQSICSSIPLNYSIQSRYKQTTNRSMYDIKKHEKALEE